MFWPEMKKNSLGAHVSGNSIGFDYTQVNAIWSQITGIEFSVSDPGVRVDALIFIAQNAYSIEF